jgi:hypothetical protein
MFAIPARAERRALPSRGFIGAMREVKSVIAKIRPVANRRHFGSDARRDFISECQIRRENSGAARARHEVAAAHAVDVFFVREIVHVQAQ